MCGIVGFINYQNAKRAAQASLKKIKYRGIDDEGFYSTDKICLAHCLHSVVGEFSQPLVNERFVLGANCEIYNWKALAAKHKLTAHNDAELLLALFTKKLKSEKNINEILDELDGVFAFFLFDKKNKTLVLARDILGVKPLWFSDEKSKFAFASEQKALGEAEELNPRKILVYKNKVKLLNRPFFSTSEKDINIEKATEKVKDLLVKAVQKRVPKRKLGLLFSGGLDSTILAFLLKKLKVPFNCYMTVCGKKNDAEQAMKIAKELKLNLKVIKVSEDKIKKALPEVISLIESADPVKVEVATTLYFSLKEARKDNIKVIFSGVGADDIFGGYKRMLAAKEINLDSISNLRRMYERDLYRDDVISMYNNIELRLPFLDKELVAE
ncbi:asparagine synthetase B, partial [Candidatus Woesearchaeota archaeon]|nr:asparagine synthetase B [Candidatus Woesearchaeota archaeon]